jgi:catechol 2,3-dioxygenase-like lactoylglutathione lyase family enzyme
MEVLMGFHHVAVRVSDIDRATRFYVEGLDGRIRTSPGTHAEPFASVVMGGTPNASFKVNHIDIPAGCIELFEFLEPVKPTGTFKPPEASQLHFAIEVEDVAAALEQVENAGGKRYWPEIQDIGGGHSAIYVTDPDGNVIELIDVSPDDLIDHLIRTEPEMAP